MNSFESSLGETLDEIDKIVKFVYMCKLNNELIKMYVTSVEYEDNGFVIEFFTDCELSKDDEDFARSDLASELLYRMNKLNGSK